MVVFLSDIGAGVTFPGVDSFVIRYYWVDLALTNSSAEYSSSSDLTCPLTFSRYTCVLFIQQSYKFLVYQLCRHWLQPCTIYKGTKCWTNQQLVIYVTNAMTGPMLHVIVLRFSCSRHDIGPWSPHVQPTSKCCEVLHCTCCQRHHGSFTEQAILRFDRKFLHSADSHIKTMYIEIPWALKDSFMPFQYASTWNNPKQWGATK